LFHRVVSDVSLLTIIKTHIARHLRFQHRYVWMQLELQTRYGSFAFPIYMSYYSGGQCSIIVGYLTIPALAGIPTQSLPLLPATLLPHEASAKPGPNLPNVGGCDRLHPQSWRGTFQPARS
jgi:hypothetical protein